MARIQDIDIPYLEFGEAAAPGTPAAAVSRLYVKSDGLFYSKDDAGVETLVSGGAGGGSVATDVIWDAAGDLVQGTGANTAAKLSAGTAGNFLKSAGAAAANVWAFPPGHEFDYVQYTSNVSITATTEATANVVVTSNAVTYDGSTIVMIDYFTPTAVPQLTAGALLDFYLYEKVGAGAAASIGLLGEIAQPAGANVIEVPPRLTRRMTPSAASIIYSIRARTTSGTATIAAGAGGSTAVMPGFIRITKV